MMNSCLACGYESPVGARFCRQCGGALRNEREETLAPTRQYQRFAPSEFSAPERLHETSRFSFSSGPVSTPDYQVPTPHGSSAPFYVLVAAVSGLATIGILSVALLNPRAARVRGAARAAEASRLEERIQRDVEAGIRRATEDANRARLDAAQRAEEAVKAADAARLKALRDINSAIPTVADLLYPDAKVVSKITAGSQEVINLQTSDDLDDIAQFYLSKLGPPQVMTGEKIIYTLNRNGVSLVIRAEQKGASRHAITIVRSKVAQAR